MDDAELWIVFKTNVESSSIVVLREVGRVRAGSEDAAIISVAEQTGLAGPLVALPKTKVDGREVRVTIHASFVRPSEPVESDVNR